MKTRISLSFCAILFLSLLISCNSDSAREVIYPKVLSYYYDLSQFFEQGYYRHFFEDQKKGLLVGNLEIIEGSYLMYQHEHKMFQLGLILTLENVSDQTYHIKKPCSIGIYSGSSNNEYTVSSGDDIYIYVETLNGEPAMHVPFLVSKISRGGPCFSKEDFILLQPGESYEYMIEEYDFVNFDGFLPGEYVIGVYYQNLIIGYEGQDLNHQPIYVDIGAWVGYVETNQIHIIIPDMTSE